MEKVKILWVSRHPPLPVQFQFLREKLGEIEIIQIVGHIPSAEYVVEEAKKRGAKYILPVLPLSFVARLVELAKQHDLTILWSEMKTIYSGNKEEAERLVAEAPDRRTAVDYANGITRVYEFATIRKITAVRIETEEL